MAFSDLIPVSKKHNLILVLLDFSFHQCVRIWLYLATDFWEEDKHAPDGMKKNLSCLIVASSLPFHG